MISSHQQLFRKFAGGAGTTVCVVGPFPGRPSPHCPPVYATRVELHSQVGSDAAGAAPNPEPLMPARIPLIRPATAPGSNGNTPAGGASAAVG